MSIRRKCLSDIGSLKDGALEDLTTWYVQPTLELVYIMDDELDLVNKNSGNANRLSFIIYELKDKLGRLERELYRLDDEAMGRILREEITRRWPSV